MQALRTGPGQPRLPVQRPARLRQDDLRPHPGPLPELRQGADADPVRGLPVLRRAGPRRARAASMSSRSTPPATVASTTPATCASGRSSPRRRPLQGLHHRRGAHGDAAGLQRPAQDRRRAAGAREVHLRHDRAGQGHRHHPLAHPPLPVPAGAAGCGCRPTWRAAAPQPRRSRSAPASCSLVVRAGGGSVRDSLSVLDQLMAGAGERGSTTSGPWRCSASRPTRCSTPRSTASRPATAPAFRQVDRVIETGQDPRRFVEDLLERLRDLIVVAPPVPDGARPRCCAASRRTSWSGWRQAARRRLAGAVPVGGHRQRRPDRDDRRDVAPAAPRADLVPASCSRAPPVRGVCRTP